MTSQAPSSLRQLVSSWCRSSLHRLPFFSSETDFAYRTFLPIHSAAAFSLCNHTFLNLFGEKHLSDLRTNGIEREVFLVCLERDLPTEWLFCGRCMKFHLPATLSCIIKRHGDHPLWDCVKRRKCYEFELRGQVTRYFCTSFRFEHVQMAMKLHRRGLDTKKFVAGLTHLERLVTANQVLHAVEARIVLDDLFIRTQQWWLIPPGTTITVPGFGFAIICAHYDELSLKRGQAELSWLLESSIDSLLQMRQRKENRQEWVRTAIRQCQYCPTEFRIDLGLLPQGHGQALVISKWMAVGKGRSPTEKEWTRRLLDYQTSYDRYDFQPGSVFTAFEGSPYFETIYQPKWTDTMTKELGRIRYQAISWSLSN